MPPGYDNERPPCVTRQALVIAWGGRPGCPATHYAQLGFSVNTGVYLVRPSAAHLLRGMLRMRDAPSFGGYTYHCWDQVDASPHATPMQSPVHLPVHLPSASPSASPQCISQCISPVHLPSASPHASPLQSPVHLPCTSHARVLPSSTSLCTGAFPALPPRLCPSLVAVLPLHPLA